MLALVADDSDENRRLVRTLLAAEGIDAVEARSAAEALDILRRQPVDVLLSDVLMPGMEGLTRSLGPASGTRVVAYSGAAWPTLLPDETRAMLSASFTLPARREDVRRALRHARG